MGHGGARPGAGRKLGAATRKTREIADRAVSEGLAPLEVMLLDMRRRWARASEIETEALAMNKADERRTTLLADADTLYGQAADRAYDAASFCHPRLSATKVSNGPTNFAALSDAQLEQIIHAGMPPGFLDDEEAPGSTQ